LLRQIGVLHERVAPAGALAVRGGPAAGEAAPALEVADWNGETVRVGGVDAEGRSTLLFFVSPSCPVCKELLPIVESVARAEARDARVVLASDGLREEHEAFVHLHGLASRRYLLSTELGLAYQVGRLPWAVLIGPDGRVQAVGLVNTREHLESLFEAGKRGVPTVQELASRRVA
ncbi:MAG: methylamine dehydrogenase accessory protein MauD, partial [Myxococcota bacterium]